MSVYDGDSPEFLREAIQNHRKAKNHKEEIAILHGISQLACQPEFKQSNSFRPLLELMDSQPTALVPETKISQNVWIGAEHPVNGLINCSVVKASYSSANSSIGNVALIGPMRMAYSTAMAAVNSVANHLQRLLN